MLPHRHGCHLSDPSPSPQRPIRPFKQLTRTTPKIAEMESIWGEIGRYSDGTAALVVSAWIDRHLEEAIKLNLVTYLTETEVGSFFINQGILESIGAKTKLAHGLGIIGPITRDGITSTTQIRNVFAHSPEIVNFETKEIVERCKGLSFIKSINAAKFRMFVSALDTGETAKEMYMATCVSLVTMLLIYQTEFETEKYLREQLANATERGEWLDLMAGIDRLSSKPVLP
jgi:DNA-binding MltR family transcriptional regulator